jgi:molybdate transport system permease protein
MAPSKQPTAPGRAARRRAGALLALAATPLLLLLALPLAALLARTPGAGLAERLASPVVVEAVLLSLTTSTIATVVTVAFGTPLGYLLGRGRFRGRGALETLVELPMILPPSVAGVALLIAFGRRGVFGPLLTNAGVELAFTTAAVVLAQVFVASPFYVKAAAGAFARIDRELEAAAMTLGASGRQVFARVTIPLVRSSLVGGAVMTWARALGEFGATIVFAGNYPGRTQTMPLAIYMGFEIDLGIALALAVILLAVSALVLGAVKLLLRAGALGPER